MSGKWAGMAWGKAVEMWRIRLGRQPEGNQWAGLMRRRSCAIDAMVRLWLWEGLARKALRREVGKISHRWSSYGKRPESE